MLELIRLADQKAQEKLEFGQLLLAFHPLPSTAAPLSLVSSPLLSPEKKKKEK